MYINRKIVLPLVLSLVFVLFIGADILFAQEMTMEEYNQRLAEWTKREADAKAEIEKPLRDLNPYACAYKSEICRFLSPQK